MEVAIKGFCRHLIGDGATTYRTIIGWCTLASGLMVQGVYLEARKCRK